MLQYIRVLWHHRDADHPVVLFYEVAADRSVPRMIEIFNDGRTIANTLCWERQRHPRFVGQSLVDGDMPDVAEIATPGEVQALLITSSEFEVAFLSATPCIAMFKDTP